MLRLAALAVLIVVSAGCGQSAGTGGKPQTPGPNTGPPDASIEFGSAPATMLQASSCWQNGNSERCVDSAGIPQILPMIPRLVVARGSAGRIHLALDPRSVHLDIGGRPVPVAPGRTVTFTPTRAGVVNLWLDAPQGSAEYLAQISFRR